MKKKVLKIIGAALLSFALGTPAHAALLNVIDHGTYFTDTVTSLDWLDVTASVDRSYLDVSSQFGSGGDFEGWRYATAAEFGSMYDNLTGEALGITGSEMYSEYTRQPYLLELITMLGDTQNTYEIELYGIPLCERFIDFCRSGGVGSTTGLLADSLPGMHNQGYLSYEHWTPTWNHHDDIVSTLYYNLDDYSHPALGSFLVRPTNTTVPEPTAFSLIVLGLTGLFFSRR